MKAHIQDPNALVGQFIRHEENGRIYRIDGVEEIGVLITEVEGMHLPALPVQEEHLFTWALVRAKYAILVQADDIKGMQ